MLTYCVDFDDLCDEVADRSIGALQQVKDRVPDFKAVLFTIPNRTSDTTIAKYKKFDEWLKLAPHGWEHTRGECLAWPHHEALSKLTQARERGIDAPAFRAPAWLINRACYEVCHDLNLTVCDHKNFYLAVSGVSIYCYNDLYGRQAKTRAVHGHLTQCNVDNFIEDMLKDGRLTFHQKTTFAYPWEVAVTRNIVEEPTE